MRIDVLGVGFDNLTMAEAVERGMELVRSPGPHYVVTPNPEIVEVCREDSGARAAVNGADLVLPDGIGVIKGAAMLGTPLKERTPGVEFATHLMDKLAEDSVQRGVFPRNMRPHKMAAVLLGLTGFMLVQTAFFILCLSRGIRWNLEQG